MCYCASVSKLQVEGRLSEEYVTILQLVILGTSNILKTAREVMDGIHFFSVPEHLSCCPVDEAQGVGVAFWML